MSKQVKGFLAEDGSFFDTKPDCDRYEFRKLIEGLCESNGTNFDNFMAMINAWSGQIKGYYDADDKCKAKWAGQGGLILDTDDELADESFLRTEEYIPDAPVGSKDAPGFLEQSIRKYK